MTITAIILLFIYSSNTYNGRKWFSPENFAIQYEMGTAVAGNFYQTLRMGTNVKNIDISE
jgi:hypothetical protein